ncbi:MAG: TRAP transporter small permease [Rhodospirillaceae bacterium]|nr:TRAP transporter small permease [Rhodospirillaceae bacterium]
MRLYDRLLDVFGVITGLIAAFLAFGISADVVIRYFRWGEIEWMLEASEYALFYLTFIGAPWALREGAHVRVDVVLSQASPAAVRRLEIAADLLGLAASLVLLIWGIKVVVASYADNSIVSKVLVFREWRMLVIIPVSAALLCVEFVRRLQRARRGRMLPEPKLDAF